MTPRRRQIRRTPKLTPSQEAKARLRIGRLERRPRIARQTQVRQAIPERMRAKPTKARRIGHRRRAIKNRSNEKLRLAGRVHFLTALALFLLAYLLDPLSARFTAVTPTAPRRVQSHYLAWVSCFRNVMILARVAASGMPPKTDPMLLPGMSAFGLAIHSSSVFSFHVMSEDLSEIE